MLRIKQPPESSQTLLFDLPPNKDIDKLGELRARSGSVAESIVDKLTDAVDIINSGNYDVVYDFFWSNNFIEVKSVRSGSSIPLYLCRMDKDREVEEMGNSLCYLIVIHKCSGVCSLQELWKQMSLTVSDMYLVPSSVVRSLVRDLKLNKAPEFKSNNGVGYNRSGYDRGYKLLPTSLILNQPMMSSVKKVTGNIYGNDFSINIHRHKNLNRKLII